jgi:hypothetical protein
MADTIVVDLAVALERIREDGLDAVNHRISRPIAEVAISPELRTALLADDFGAFDCIVGPRNSSLKFFPAFEPTVVSRSRIF